MRPPGLASGTDGAGRWHAAPSPASRSPLRWSSWLLAPRRPGRPGRRRRRPTEARPQLLGHDLDGGAGAAVLSGPGALLEPAHDYSAASACGESHLIRTARSRPEPVST